MSNTRAKLVITTEDGRFTVAQSEEPDWTDDWFLEVEVNTEGGYMSATLDGKTLLRISDWIRGAVTDAVAS